MSTTSIPGTVLDSTSSMVVCLTEWGAVCKIKFDSRVAFDSRVEIRWKVYPTGRSLSKYVLTQYFLPPPPMYTFGLHFGDPKCKLIF